MPIPITPMHDFGTAKKEETNLLLDYSFLSTHFETNKSSKKQVFASNKDADLLFDIWLNAKQKNKDLFDTSDFCSLSSRDLMRLKVNGFVSGEKGSISFTEKAKRVIMTMALGETNKFLNSKRQKSYTEILASMDKKNKPGYRVPKFASCNKINLKNEK